MNHHDLIVSAQKAAHQLLSAAQERLDQHVQAAIIRVNDDAWVLGKFQAPPLRARRAELLLHHGNLSTRHYAQRYTMRHRALRPIGQI